MNLEITFHKKVKYEKWLRTADIQLSILDVFWLFEILTNTIKTSKFFLNILVKTNQCGSELK